MVEITLVRHGQAQTGAQDEASYDRLSELGERQAGWLGAHLAETGQRFDRMICGTLLRQRQTAEHIGRALGQTAEEDPRLNEMDYFGLAQSMQATDALEVPTDRDSFLTHISQVMEAWAEGRIRSPRESFPAFEARVRGVLDDAQAGGGRVLLVTSGGVISNAMRVLMRLDLPAFTHVLMHTMNTSLHRYVDVGDDLVLESFNAVPHLERPGRLEARSFT